MRDGERYAVEAAWPRARLADEVGLLPEQGIHQTWRMRRSYVLHKQVLHLRRSWQQQGCTIVRRMLHLILWHQEEALVLHLLPVLLLLRDSLLLLQLESHGLLLE